MLYFCCDISKEVKLFQKRKWYLILVMNYAIVYNQTFALCIQVSY